MDLLNVNKEQRSEIAGEVPSGFYYDNQKNNPFLRVSLHANTKPPISKYDKWVGWCDKVAATSIDPDFPTELTISTEPDIDEGNEPKNNDLFDNPLVSDIRYGSKALCTSIIQEDFNVSISNSWAEFMGGGQLQDLFNSAIKPLQPYTDLISSGLKKMGGTLTKSDGKFANSDFGKGLAGFLNKAGDKGTELSNVMTRSLVVQGTRFKYYSGTGISFGNLGMKFTLFSDYIEETDDYNIGKKTYKWKSVFDQLSAILPYSMGEYIPFYDPSDPDKFINDVGLKDWIEKNGKDKIANTFFGWQTPPGGFRPNVQYIDTIQVGTLMLKVGPYYTLKNLLIQDVQLNYSKQMVKYWNFNENKLETCPMYCDVFITFTPATKYSSNMLKNFVHGKKITSTYIDNNKELTNVTVLPGNEESLTKLKNEINKRIEKSTK